MNVPFIASGALSRAHYALVRRVESADTSQLADQYLLTEVQSAKHRLAHRTLSLVSSLVVADNPEETDSSYRNNARNA
jgi:AP-4 complex subunit epsilon-1